MRCGELAAQGQPPERAFFVELPVPPQRRIREGIDYKTPEERIKLIEERGLQDGPRFVPVANERVLEIVRHMLYEIGMFTHTRQFIDGKPWGDQPTWRIGFFLCFWTGQGQQESRRAMAIEAQQRHATTRT